MPSSHSVCISDISTDQLLRLIGDAASVCITCHVSPDGDAVGSSLGLAHTLRAMGKAVTVITPDAPAKNLMCLPGAADILVGSHRPDAAARAFSHADLIFCMDFNEMRRIDRLAPMVEGSGARRVLIDHHLDPTVEADVVFSDPSSSSTCALLFLILERAGLYGMISRDAATCIYTGMMTDTGNFSYNASDPGLYRIIALLIEKGIDKDEIYRRVWFMSSLKRMRLCAYAILNNLRIYPEHGLALITLSADELKRLDYSRGDTESLVNQPLAIPGVVWSVFLRQDDENYIKVSMRSVGDFPVNIVCHDHFGGGGHLNASGGDSHLTLDQTVDKLLALAPAFDSYLPDPSVPQRNL
ncbi:MAG: bifunctional oligoribonuclease/PAP phosphatase NrnA [Paramuribaculum sp.]|nr:bifunctional oligoribonuclease/PAP phosphatase NrnA [Paramuribaculum sp.]